MTETRFFKETKTLFEKLSEIPTVSGYEKLHADEIKNCVLSFTSFFDRAETLTNGTVLLCHSAEKESAPTLLLDAHIDTVGFAVAEILDGGFLHVEACGGIDRRILFAHEIEIHGKKKIKGIFAANPPHLKKTDGDSKTLPPLSEIPLDTGFPAKKLEKLVSVGDMCTYGTKPFMMQNDILCGMGMDNKICACAVIMAAKLMEQDVFDGVNICLSLSACEETNGSGIEHISRLSPDAAIVLDVNFGRTHDIHPKESYVLGDGCGVSYSCTTSRNLTDSLICTAKKCKIPLSVMVEATNTGTNAHRLNLSVPCAVLSVPEKFMHSYHEQVSLHDVRSAALLICEFCRDFPQYFGKSVGKRLVKGKIHGGEKHGL